MDSGPPWISLEGIQKDFFGLGITPIGHIHIGFRYRVDPFIGIDRRKPGLTEIGLDLAAAACINTLPHCAAKNRTRSVTEFGQRGRRGRSTLTITALVQLVAAPSEQQRENASTPNQQRGVIRRRLDFRRLDSCGLRHGRRRRRDRPHLGNRLRRLRKLGLFSGNGRRSNRLDRSLCDGRLRHNSRRRSFRLHLGHALALQFDQALKLLDTFFEFGQASIGFAQCLVPRNQIFLERLQAEYYQRWLDNFDADGLLPVGEIKDTGFYAQGSFFPIKQKLEVYGVTSQIYGDEDAGFGDSSEYGIGMNWYPYPTRNHRLNVQLLDVNDSPVSSTFGYYTGGQDGWTLASSFSIFF